MKVAGQSTRTTALSDVSLIVAYESADGSDVFTASQLQRMCEMEAKWFQADDYADFCPLDAK